MSDKPKLMMESTFSGPKADPREFRVVVSGPLSVGTIDAAIRQLSLYREFVLEMGSDGDQREPAAPQVN